jgi:molybdate transport system substrate-binding protein
MRFKHFVLAAVTLLIVLSAPSGGCAAEVSLFAAISLSDALKEIQPIYEKASGDELSFNFAGSNDLARQIDAGAPADLFFSADEAKMDFLASKNRLLAGSRRSLLGNTLVIVIPKSASFAISDPKQLDDGSIVKKLALANPDAVPAGIYAKQFLTKLGIWDHLKGDIIPTENVRACLAAVESANADAGIVYETDAMTSHEIKVAYEVPAAEGPHISYPLAVITSSIAPEKEAERIDHAKKFAAYLESPDAAKVFVKFGFTILP